MLEYEIELAMKDWEEIPTMRIAEIAAEARKQAGEFMPTNGLMAKIWREVLGDKREAAQRAIREANTAKYLNLPKGEPTTDAEIDTRSTYFADLSRQIRDGQ
jgi:hypothetical protein